MWLIFIESADHHVRMIREPYRKRVVAFVDGQNLYFAAKHAFGHTWPNYDPLALARRIAGQRERWDVTEVRFYTGVPNSEDNPRWNHFWTAKCAQLGRERVKVFTRPLRYRTKTVVCPDGLEHAYRDGDEKGIDVRIAVDVIRLANDDAYDVALLFSQDQDFSEVASEIRIIAANQGRWIKMASAFPDPRDRKVRGVNGTDWIRIGQDVYDACIDMRDYRPKRD